LNWIKASGVRAWGVIKSELHRKGHLKVWRTCSAFIPLRATAVDAERPVTAHRRGFNFSDQGIPFAEKKVCKVCAGIHKACQPKGFLCPDELCGSTLFGASHNEPHSRVVKKQYCSCGCLLCKRQDGGRKRLQMATPSSQN